MQEATAISAHAFPLEQIGRHLFPGKRLVVLSRDGETVITSYSIHYTKLYEAEGHAVDICDLYAEGFDPLFTPDELNRDCTLPPRIAAEIVRLKAAEAVIVVHPNWS